MGFAKRRRYWPVASGGEWEMLLNHLDIYQVRCRSWVKLGPRATSERGPFTPS
jgi:hypothetical protein